MNKLTYAPVGATRTGDLPSGYRHLRYRALIGTGESTYRRAAEAVLAFDMHRGIGTRVRASADRAAPGVRVTIGAGPLSAPCAVVWADDTPERAGFGYGTLAGHPAAGEEAFLVVRDEPGQVWFTVTAYSRPARWPMRLAGPAAVPVQHLYARLCARSLRRLATVNG